LLRPRKSPSGSGFAGLPIVVRSSSFARTATADSVIAAWLAVCKPASHNSVPPAAGINKVRKDASTIAIGNVLTAAARPLLH
jgi:hypothetical protein